MVSIDTTRLGALYAARWPLTWAMSADSSIGEPATGSTTAVIASPNLSSGSPTTTASATDGSVLSASSTSSGKTFSPPVLMHTEPRPNRLIVPSASTVA